VTDREWQVGVLGDFSGRGSARVPLARESFRSLDADLDSFDSMMKRLSCSVELDLPGCEELSFAGLEDLHPDSIARRVPTLAPLLEARGSLDQPGRMRECIQRAGASLGPVLPRDEAGKHSERAEPLPAQSDQLLEELLDAAEPVARRRPAVDPTFAALVEEIAEASADRTDYAEQARWRDAIDAELSVRMRAILRAPALQGFEGRWRALRRLVRSASGEYPVRVRMLDVTPQELADPGVGSEARSWLRELVVEREAGTAGGMPFDLLLVDFSAEANPLDEAALRFLAELGRAARVPVVGSAGTACWESVLGGATLPWRGLRATPEAAFLCTACPRFLLRLPYGEGGEPIDAFRFEEWTESDGPPAPLWGSPAYLLAEAFVRSAASSGSLKDLREFLEIEDLEFHAYRREGEPHSFGPLERVFSDKELRRLAEAGFVPLSAARGQVGVRIPLPCSLAGRRLWAAEEAW